jgi:Dolichyl-phosphate-mannose-protein mannosyltransferase
VVAAITLLAAFLRLYRIDSLPPSAGYDQAAYGVDALAILQGARPVFLTSNFGREALFSYLVALCHLVVRDTAVAVYVTSALIGVLTIPVVYLVTQELFRAVGHPDRQGVLSRWGGVLAALALAVSHWHVSWSRLGMRAILVPLLASTTVYLLWKGLRTKSCWAFAGCGISLGLSIYSYQAARALPLLVMLGFVYVLWSRRALSWRDLFHLALVAVLALAVYAPLGWYFYTHPGSSSVRVKQAAVVGQSQDVTETVKALLERASSTLLTFGIRGNEDARVTLPGQPALNPFLAAALVLGTVISVARFREPQYLLLLTWLAGLTMPAVLAEYGAVTKRAIGALPAVAALIAVGCIEPWDALCRWANRQHPGWSRAAQVGMPALIALGMLCSGVQTVRDYFLLWGQDPNLFTHFEAGQSAIGRYIKERPTDEAIYLSPTPADHPSVLLGSELRQGVKSYNGRFCMVVPQVATHGATYVIVPAEDKNSISALQRYMPQGQVVDQGPLHYQQPYFLAYRVPIGAEAQIAPASVLRIDWDGIQLLGYDLNQAAYAPGDAARLTLYLKSTGSMSRDYTIFVHLLGPTNPASGGPIWAQDDTEPCRRSYPTSAWSSGEILVDHLELAIPGEAPAAQYELEIGFYDWQTMERLPILDSGGRPTADHAILAELRISPQP